MNLLKYKTVADQVRALGLKVGDTIEGTWQGEYSRAWWNTVRLTLLWVGKDVAVWSETNTSSINPKWSKPKECTSWDLSYRDWRKVKP